METTPNSQEAQGSAAPASQQPPVDWEARYKGVNDILQRKTTDWQANQAKFDATIASITQENLGWKDQVGTLSKTLQEAQSQYQEATSKIKGAEEKAATLEKSLNRAKVFLQPEFNGLAPMEAKGLLRTDLEGDDFANYLKEMSTVMGQKIDQRLEQTMQGATSGTPSGSRQDGTTNKDVLWSQLDAALKKGDYALHQSLLDEWFKANSPA